MKRFKLKIKQIKQCIPILIVSATAYITSGFGYYAIENSTLKMLLYIFFMISFGIFTGTIVSLMNLKYIGKFI